MACSCGGPCGTVVNGSTVPVATAQCCPVVVATMPNTGCNPSGEGGGFLGRFAPTVARLRNRFNVSFGTKAYDVFLVWTRWDGDERGEGYEHEVMRLKLLPDPVVEDLTAIALQGFSGGVLPVGGMRISQVTPMLTADNLIGNTLPNLDYLTMISSCGYPGPFREGTPSSLAGLTLIEAAKINAGLTPREPRYRIGRKIEFFYEIVEKGVPNAQRHKFRIAGLPFKRKTSFDWSVILEKVSEDRSRSGRSQIGPDRDD